MSLLREKIIRKLWRGQDPFRSHIAERGTPDLQGWGSQHPYLTEAVAQLRPEIVVEVGVWKGASVIHMASQMRDLAISGLVIAVDTWLGAWDHWTNDRIFSSLDLLNPEKSLFSTFLKNVKDSQLEDYIVPLPIDSVNAAHVLRYFGIRPNVVHIDAAHDYSAVGTDLRQWWPLLVNDGLLIGDDYRAGNDWPGVKRAFDDHFRPLGLLPLENRNDKCRVRKPANDSKFIEALGDFRLTASAVSGWRERCRIEFSELAESDAISPEDRIRRYINFCGPKWDPIRNRVMERIANEYAKGQPNITRHSLFGPDGAPNNLVLAKVAPEISGHYFRPASTEGFQSTELLPRFKNPFAIFALPSPLNKNMAKLEGGPLLAYRAQCVDLFITPLGYQVFNEDQDLYWPSASTRSYPREAISGSRKHVTDDVVLIQDIFEGSNFSHFLFDWIPRLGHFLNAGITNAADCIFVMGGPPSEFHARILQIVCDLYNLRMDQFCFPDAPEIWQVRGSLYFFSDAKDSVMHPAHMAHKRSIAIIREICSQLSTPTGEAKRIYISRNDTPLRRVANEADLLSKLMPLGFVEVRLASIPLLEQIELVRGAEIIIAPHGMGLTHIAFHQKCPLIIELHNPKIGTDTYAFPAHALGFEYRPVMGSDLGVPGHHYSISPEDVLKTLRESGALSARSEANEISRHVVTTFEPGVQSTKAVTVTGRSLLGAMGPIYQHTRDDPNTQADNNVGWLKVSGLQRGIVYHFSCNVWIPKTFRGSSVALQCPGMIGPILHTADFSKTDQWQPIRISGVAASDAHNIVLRCDADSQAFFFSNDWRVDTGGYQHVP